MELVSSFVIVVLFGSTDCCAVGVLGSLFFGVNICLSDDREGMRWMVGQKYGSDKKVWECSKSCRHVEA